MECYEGATMIKSFRGLIADGVQDTIVLHTNDGSMGYKITKFQCMQDGFGNSEMVIKIYKVSQSTIDNAITFDDNTLLGACMISGSAGGEGAPEDITIIFDNEIFNQDIYITASVSSSSDGINYYLELEQVKLDLSESTVATLKDIRNITDPVTTA